MRITTELLRSHNACIEQVKLFQATFPEAETGVAVNSENWEIAKSAGLNLFWLLDILPPAAQVEYQKIKNSALAECEKIVNSAEAEYLKIRYSAWAEYQKIRYSAEAEYQKIRDSALFRILESL